MSVLQELIAVASNPVHEDVVRIPALESFVEVARTDEERLAAAHALAAVVADRTDDYLVRQIAAKELAFFPEPSNKDGLVTSVLDPDDDLDVRVNLIVAFERWNPDFLSALRGRLSPSDELARQIGIVESQR